jgi:hypothetical protein
MAFFLPMRLSSTMNVPRTPWARKASSSARICRLVLILCLHPAEGQVIIDGRDQPRATVREGGRARPLAVFGVVVQVEGTGPGVGPPSAPFSGRRSHSRGRGKGRH